MNDSLIKVSFLLMTYSFIKENHQEQFALKLKEQNNDDIAGIKNIIINVDSELDRKEHIFLNVPDKDKKIKQSMSELQNLIQDNSFSENDFIEKIEKYLKYLNKDENKIVLKVVLNTMLIDNNISTIEREIIGQILTPLKVSKTVDQVVSEYKKKEPKLKVFIAIIFIVILLGSALSFIVIQPKDNINIFKEKQVIFNELYFNRYVVHGNIKENKVNNEQSAHKRQVVYYISGKVEVSFNPRNIKQSQLQPNTLVVIKHDKFITFKTHIIVKEANILKVDDIKPLDFTFSKKGIDNAWKSLTKAENISQKERDDVIYKSITNIEKEFNENEVLADEYKGNFEQYIQLRYALAGIDIIRFEYLEEER